MVHLNHAADGFIKLEAQASGLADVMFEGAKALEVEKGSENLLNEFAIATTEVEMKRVKELVSLTNDPKMTLNKHCKQWGVRKSEINKAIKLGLTLSDYENFSQLRKGIDKKTGSNASGTNTGKGKDIGTDNAKVTTSSGGGSPSKLHSVTSSLDSKVQTKLDSLVTHMTQLTTEGQLALIAQAEGQVKVMLAKNGGRFANVA